MRSLLVVAIGLMLAMPAAAQTDARVGVGVGVTFFESTGRGIDDSVRLTPVIRGRRRGFAPAVGFNWLATEVVPSAAAIAVRGDLRVRPVMVGPSYTVVRGRVAATAAVVGGYSFNRIASIVPEGGPPVTLRVDNSLAWAPTATVAVDLSRRFGLVTQASYLVTRPTVTLRSAALEDRSRWKADTLVIQVGVVVGLF